MVRLVLVVLLVCGVVVGCGVAEPEGPFPVRPAEIDVSNLDLCSLLTPAQRTQLSVDEGEPGNVVLPEGPSRTCTWPDNDAVISYAVQTISEPASTAVGASDSSLDTVGGFGAVRVTAYAESTPLCEFYLDTGDADTLRVQVQAVGYGDDDKPLAMTRVCEQARALAGFVVENAKVGHR